MPKVLVAAADWFLVRHRRPKPHRRKGVLGWKLLAVVLGVKSLAAATAGSAPPSADLPTLLAAFIALTPALAFAPWAQAKQRRSRQVLPCQLTPAETNAAERPAARVLVADHNTANRRVLVRMLESVGVCADAAADSRQAVEMLRLLAYDLVLMDCGMPDMESIAAAARTPIVAMTAGFSGAEHDLLMENGTRDILLKPVPRLALEAVLRKWLPQRNEVISISA